MAVLVSIDHETGNMSAYTTVEGTPTVVAPPASTAYTGNFVLSVPRSTDTTPSDVQKTWTNAPNAYVRVALRVNVAANPTGTEVVQMLSLHSSTFGADMGAIWLRVTAAGVPGLILRNANLGTDIGAIFTLTTNTWYIGELKNHSAGAAGTIEMRVDGTVQATGTADIGGNVGLIRLGQNAGAVSGTVTCFFDVLVVDDAVYPGIPTAATRLFRTARMDGLGAGGPFFANPLGG